MQTQIAVFTAVVPLHLRGGALWCTFQWLVKENFCNWTQKQEEKKTCVCKTWMHHSCHEGSQNRLKRRVLQKRISAKDAAQTGLVQNIFSFPRQLLILIAIWERASVFLGNVQIEAKKSVPPRTSRQTMGFVCQRWFSGSRTLVHVQLVLFHF